MKVLTWALIAFFLANPRAHAGEAAKAAPGKLEGDLQAVKTYGDGLAAVLKFAASRPDLFPRERGADRLRTRKEKEEIWQAWKSFMDYFLALDSIKDDYKNFNKYRSGRRKLAFLTAYSAFLSQYRSALEWIDLSEAAPELDVILNEPVPEIGLPKGTYADFKFRFLNVGRAAEFTAFETLHAVMKDPSQTALEAKIKEDAAYVWKTGRIKGEVQTAKNALRIIKSAGLSAWLPVQSGVSVFMGDTKVYRFSGFLISPEQIRSLAKVLEPGDILLERREWYLSNIGLPGFWPHAALYVGTPEERQKYFQDPEFEPLLKSKYPQAYGDSLKTEQGHALRILEAMSEGVVFTSLEHSAYCDSLAVLRPSLTKKEKALAILRAFHFSGRPYDFDFDFQTDSSLVCSELIYKCYEPSEEMTGLRLPAVSMLGRLLTPPNEIARMLDQEEGSGKEQLKLVSFLDGNERARMAKESDLEEFRKSWQRPKWHIFVQEITKK